MRPPRDGQRELKRTFQAQFKQLEARIASAESLQEIIRMINAQVPLDELLHRAVQLAAHRQGAGACVLHQFDVKNEVVVQVASFGMEGIFQDKLTRPFSQLTISGGGGYLEALERHIPIYQNYPPFPERVEEIKNNPHIPDAIKAERIALRTRYAASFAVPIYLQNVLYGGMVFYYREPQQFREDQIQLGLAFGEQISVALQNAYLVKEMEQRQRVAEGFRDIVRKINSTESLQEVLNFIVEKTEDILECQCAALYTCEGRDIQLQALRGTFPVDVSTVVTHYGEGVIGRAIAEKRQFIITDVSDIKLAPSASEIDETHPIYLDPIHQQLDACITSRFKAVMALPLISQDHSYGALAFYYTEPHRFDQYELDLTEVFASQAVLAIENAMLRKQAAQVAAHAERDRLARDLHDSVSQSLFSANLIAQSLPKLWKTMPEKALDELANLQKLTRGAQSEMRALLFELRPQALETTDLQDLAGHVINAFSGKTLIPVESSVEITGPIPLQVKLVVYRIIQEALNNIAKHAKARKVWLNLRGNAHCLSLHIQDDGVGFALQHLKKPGLGLSIMDERAKLVGGYLVISSEPGKGSRITFTWMEEDHGTSDSGHDCG
uniref:GAF domain-containing protein n=1 Tax=Gracilinema caldarium TaxID=215591 RepID=A0A7C3IKF3_9SPIR